MTSLMLVLFLSAGVPEVFLSCKETNDLIKTLDEDPWINKKENINYKKKLGSQIRRSGPSNCGLIL